MFMPPFGPYSSFGHYRDRYTVKDPLPDDPSDPLTEADRIFTYGVVMGYFVVSSAALAGVAWGIFRYFAP